MQALKTKQFLKKDIDKLQSLQDFVDILVLLICMIYVLLL